MNKIQVLEHLRGSALPQTPDQIRWKLRIIQPRTSVYSFLLRMARSKLLNRNRIGGRIAYSIADRGIARLHYLNSRKGQT